MLFESAAPKPRPSHLSWHYCKVAPGTAIKGWIAGRTIGVDVHWSGSSSKPCCKRLTKGLVPCSYCDLPKPQRVRWIGYCPLIAHSGKREVVVVSESIGPRVEQLACRMAVEFRRSSGARDPLTVRLCATIANGDSYDELGKCPIPSRSLLGEDITPWLLQLWNEPQLTAFFAAQVAALELENSTRDTQTHNEHSPTPAADAPAAEKPGSVADEFLRRIEEDLKDGVKEPRPLNGRPRRK